MLTVVPDKENSLIILAANPNSKPAIKFIDHLDDVSEEKYLHAISSLITTLAENTFWSPKLWDALGEQARTVLKNNASYLFDESKPQKFPWSSLNLYHEKFTASKLGIIKF
jgi:hypothetical protein